MKRFFVGSLLSMAAFATACGGDGTVDGNGMGGAAAGDGDGAPGEACSVSDNEDGTATISCPDGSSFTAEKKTLEGSTRFLVEAGGDLTLFQVSGSAYESWRVNPRFDATVNWDGYVVSEDNTKVVYLADADENEEYEIYLSDISAEPTKPVQVNGPLVVDGDVTTYGISPDGNWVAYIADQDDEGIDELYVVDISGGSPGTPVKVSSTDVDGAVTDFVFAPNSQLLAYRGDMDSVDDNELFLVDLSDPEPGQKVNGTLLGDVTATYSFSPDSAMLYYLADENVLDKIELYGSDVSSGTPATAETYSDIGNTADVSSFAVSPDSAWVVYQANEDNLTIEDLYLVPADDAGSVTNLYTPDDDAISVSEYVWSGNSKFVVFVSDLLDPTDDINQLLSVDINDGAPNDPTAINGTLVEDGNVTNFQMNAAGNKIVYMADQDVDTRNELYMVNPSGSNDPVKVNAALPSTLSVGNEPYVWAEDADVVMYAHPNSSGLTGTGVVDLSGAEPARKLFTRGTDAYNHFVRTLSEDGQHLYTGVPFDGARISSMDGVSVEMPVVFDQPIEFVNPKQ